MVGYGREHERLTGPSGFSGHFRERLTGAIGLFRAFPRAQ